MSHVGNKSEILKLKHLPPLSATATRLLEMIGDSAVEIEDLASVIEQDPGLSARILGLANSAYFAQANPINTVKNAIIRVLGLNMVKSLALSIAMAGTFDTRNCEGFSLADYWFSALGCAALAKQLANKTPQAKRPHLDSVYLCGVMWNLGALILAHQYPQASSQVYREKVKNPEASIIELEREIIGIDRQQAGQWVAERWHLPEAVVHAITHYSDPEYEGEDRFLVLLVGAASTRITAYLADEESSLLDSDVLKSKMGLAEDILINIETDFRAQCDGLQSTANMLV